MTSKQDEVVRSPRTYDASVRRAQTPEQDDLVAHQEHCSADPRRLATVGAGRGAQVRIVRSDAEYALFTVSEVRPESPDTVVRMGKDSRERLGTPEEFSAVLDTRVARSELTDERARSGSEFVERLQDNGHQRRLVVLAPHGGDIEPHTDEQAEYLAARLPSNRVSVWLCKGFRVGGGAARRWHITSDNIDPGSFPALGSIFGRGFARAVSFHGFDRPELPDQVVVGGAARNRLKRCVAAAIRDALAGTGFTVRIAAAGDPLGGANAANIVNRITANGRRGVQIEQAPEVRDQHALAVAEAVARFYRRGLLGVCGWWRGWLGFGGR
ncbi:MAG TPA: poly-gamma-glutamate hydrolase family protein [Kribbellaceae bacterium]